MKYYSHGFTLIELVITMAVLGILLAFGIPAFNGVIENNRVTTQANSLLGAVNYARSEAVKRGEIVSLQSEVGGFGNGWCVILGPLDGCQNARDNDLLVREFGAIRAVIVDAGGTNGVSFDNRGYRVAPAGNVVIGMQSDNCQANADGRRELTVSTAGRASLTREECE
ncbi:MAG: Tfp pilus assembly protein FimT [Marinobacter excellens HL-55]|uniref:Type II secretion system protein H n=1 Tax=Marinobacter excellens HL-55 TaxID=1305731 RepID=A0A0P7YYQ2_9GAMM|nr:MAG: Tfp pilus assembly protein FimT [Marinobacter excellens HL-55]